MKKKNTIVSLVKDAALITAFATTKLCMDKIEKQMHKDDKDEETLNRKLTVLSVI